MSRFLTKNENGDYVENIDSLYICRWKINEVCCSDKSEYAADYPYPYCKCESKMDCKYFEKEKR